MSLFTCPECGFQDNTAGSGYYQLKQAGLPVRCSACNPLAALTATRAMDLRPNGEAS